MVRKDFEDGGFPINNKAPVLCVTVDGLVFFAYTNYDLKNIFDIKRPEIKRVMGIWPGKGNTDIFVLNPEKYGLIAPPEEHKEIDNANEIIIEYTKDNEFRAVMYTVHRGPLIVSKDSSLEKYIKMSGKKYVVNFV